MNAWCPDKDMTGFAIADAKEFEMVFFEVISAAITLENIESINKTIEIGNIKALYFIKTFLVNWLSSLRNTKSMNKTILCGA